MIDREEIKRAVQMLIGSGMVKDQAVTPEKVEAALTWAAELGFTPVAGWRALNLLPFKERINGQETGRTNHDLYLSVEGAKALALATGEVEAIGVSFQNDVAHAEVKRRGMERVSVAYGKPEAERAGLLSSPAWQRAIRNKKLSVMLEKQALKEALDICFGDVQFGLRPASRRDERDQSGTWTVPGPAPGEVVGIPGSGASPPETPQDRETPPEAPPEAPPLPGPQEGPFAGVLVRPGWILPDPAGAFEDAYDEAQATAIDKIADYEAGITFDDIQDPRLLDAAHAAFRAGFSDAGFREGMRGEQWVAAPKDRRLALVAWLARLAEMRAEFFADAPDGAAPLPEEG